MNWHRIIIIGVIQIFCFASAFADTRAIVGGTLVDVEDGNHIQNSALVIKDERIVAVGRRQDVDILRNAEVIDASGSWLVPGLMNMHVHLGLKLPGKMQAELYDETDSELVLRMAAAARDVLEAGVTTIRLTGDGKGNLALKRSIDKGESIGPHIFSAGHRPSTVITAGHGSEAGKVYADGPYELIKGARKEISKGASWIKIRISGGIATDGGGIAESLMTPEEISAVIDAAHRFDAKVAAHSGSTIATDVAVDHGIDSIEHGYMLDRDVLRKMADKGTWLVPTIVVSQPATQPFFERIGSPEWYLERRNSVGKEHWKTLEMAIEEDVNIALGSDQHPNEPNDGTTATAREAQYYVEAGMTPLQALQAATIQAARMLDADSEIGSLSVGKYADVIAVPTDPTDDIKALRDIPFVMKSGKIYRNNLAN